MPAWMVRRRALEPVGPRVPSSRRVPRAGRRGAPPGPPAPGIRARRTRRGPAPGRNSRWIGRTERRSARRPAVCAERQREGRGECAHGLACGAIVAHPCPAPGRAVLVREPPGDSASSPGGGNRPRHRHPGGCCRRSAHPALPGHISGRFAPYRRGLTGGNFKRNLRLPHTLPSAHRLLFGPRGRPRYVAGRTGSRPPGPSGPGPWAPGAVCGNLRPRRLFRGTAGPARPSA